MEDRIKISELEEVNNLGLDDFFAVVVNGATVTNKTRLSAIAAALDTNAVYSEVFFSFGAPSPELGTSNDVYFNLTDKVIYQKDGFGWNIKTTFETKRSTLTFTATEGQTSYTNILLTGATIKHVFADGFRNGITVAHNTVTGTLSFDALNANTQIIIMYV